MRTGLHRLRQSGALDLLRIKYDDGGGDGSKSKAEADAQVLGARQIAAALFAYSAAASVAAAIFLAELAVNKLGWRRRRRLGSEDE